jgi:hypothetical protein
LWIYVNLDAGSNFCEFSHIMAGSRMQPLTSCSPLAGGAALAPSFSTADAAAEGPIRRTREGGE